jgi:hypothetical protein
MRDEQLAALIRSAGRPTYAAAAAYEYKRQDQESQPFHTIKFK